MSPDDSTWIEEFAKFLDFMNDCIEFFLPWILRAARHFEEIEGDTERPWLEWARFVELGVDNNWAVQMLDENVLEDKGIARTIGHRLAELSTNGDLTIDTVRQITVEVIGGNNPSVANVLNWYSGLDL